VLSLSRDCKGGLSGNGGKIGHEGPFSRLGGVVGVG